MINRYIVFAALIIVIVAASYFINFYLVLGYTISSDSALWAQLGDYLGGVLNPLLSFITIVLLIKSLNLQNEANVSLREELKNAERSEKLKSVESLYFNMIDSQKRLFDSFRLDFSKRSVGFGKRNLTKQFTNIKAVIRIEDEISLMRGNGCTDSEVSEYLEELDVNDQIFGLSRAFYIMVRLVCERLSESDGFTPEDRAIHFETLVNFTDYAQLRLIMMCIQFTEYQSALYLKDCVEFKQTIEGLGMSYELY